MTGLARGAGRGQRQHGTAQHHDEADDTDDDLDQGGGLEQHRDDEQTDAERDDGGTGEHASAGDALEGRSAQGGRELGVLLDEGALHLLEQSQFFLGELHGSSSTFGAQV